MLILYIVGAIISLFLILAALRSLDENAEFVMAEIPSC
jgi:hypothetical protein